MGRCLGVCRHGRLLPLGLGLRTRRRQGLGFVGLRSRLWRKHDLTGVEQRRGMAGALQRKRIPSDGARAAGQEQSGQDLARMAEDESESPLAGAGIPLGLGRALLRLCRRLPPHDGRQIEVIVRLINKSFTQEDRSVFGV